MNSKHPSKLSTAEFQKPESLAQTVPPEIFILICENLTPRDLFSLSRGCRRYKSLLGSKTSTVTQQIWRTSRHRYLPNCQIAPPEGMSEQRYIWLSMFTNRCEFCELNDENAETHIYWVLRVRCCLKCLIERTVSKKALLQERKISKDVITCLPYVHPCGYRLYWQADILAAQAEYSKLDAIQAANWIAKKHELARRITLYSKIRETAYNHEQYQMGVNIGYQIAFDNWRRRAGTMLKEIREELGCDVVNVAESSIYREWEKYFDAQWEEEMWDEWRAAMKKESQRMQRKKYLPVKIFSSLYGKLSRK